MADTITLSGDYKYDSYRALGLEDTIIDASEAQWIVSNIGSQVNRYPVSVYNGSNISLVGGTINGKVPLDIDWTKAYVNSAAVLVKGSDDVLIQDWRISQAWDGIRVVGDKNDGFTIDSVWLSEIRDDAIENDTGLGGTISNSLFDGVFMGISTGNPYTDNRGNVVTVDDVMIRMETYLYKGMDTHGSPFKVYDNSPNMKIYNSVFAIEEVNHRSDHALERAWEKTIDASGNYYLNLSDEPLPDNYPLPPKGFTVLQGKEARSFWDAARSEQIAEITGGGTTAAVGSGTSAAVSGGTAAAAGGETLRKAIVAGSDDTDQNAGAGTVNLTKADVELGDGGRDIGLRFTDLDLESLEGANILDAYIEFTARSGSSGAIDATVKLEDTLSAATFSAGSGPTDRDMFEFAEASWNDSSVPAAGSTFRTDNFADLIEDFLAAKSDDLGTDDDLAFVIKDDSGVRKALSFEGGAAPELVLIFDLG